MVLKYKIGTGRTFWSAGSGVVGLDEVLEDGAGTSRILAIRLAKAFGSTTETWIRLQAAYDVARAQAREDEIQVERSEPQPGSVERYGTRIAALPNARPRPLAACPATDWAEGLH